MTQPARLSDTQRAFVTSAEPYPAFVGGFGCVRDSTEIATPSGFVCVADLPAGGDVLSWSETDRIFQHAPATGSFPKGKGNLYRVITTQGEFVASGHHRVRVPNGSYQPVEALRAGMALSGCGLSLQPTSTALDRIWLPEGDRNYWQTLAGYLGDCEGGANQCDPRLRQAVDSALVSSQLRADAHKSGQCSFPEVLAQTDDRLALKQKHSRLDRFDDHQRIASSVRLAVALAQGAEGIAPKEYAGRILALTRQFVQFALTSVGRQLGLLCAQFEQVILAFSGAAHQSHALALGDSFHGQDLARMPGFYQQDRRFAGLSVSHQSALKLEHEAQGSVLAYSSTIKTPIISIEQLKRKEWYWDLHVAGNNNYITKDGVIHHNSGKTAAAISRAMDLKIRCREQNVAYYLPTYPLIKDIAFERFPELCERKGWTFKLNQQDSEIRFPGAGKIIFRNMEQPDRIVGYEVAHSLVDEIDTMATDKARHAWNKIIARNRQKCGMHNSVGVATTPEGFKFVYERWVKDQKPGYVLFKAKTRDNAAHLPPNYISDLEASYTPALLAAYLDGEFVNLTAGSIYPEFDRILNNSTETIRHSEPLHIGMDFNVGQMSAIVFVMRDGDPHAVDEITGALDTPAMIAAIKSRYVGHAIYVYPDSSGGSRKTVNASESDIALLRAARFSVFAPSANPPVKNRILAMNQLIHSEGRRRLKVNADRCPTFVECLEKQAYDKNGEPDKSSGLDHANDAAGYFAHYKFPVRGRGLQRVSIGGI